MGSVVSVADANGGLIDSAGRGFDPFGKPREDDWRDSDGQNGETPSQPGDLNRNDLTTRGFTGHEHLNETDLIHMNGRVYDYNLGRFLSVDPFIQFPENSQSMNAYSYILNNPLSGTDPTGYTTEAPDASQSGTGNSSGGNSAADQAKEMSAEGGMEKVTFTHQRGRTGCRACKGAVTGGTVTFGNGSSVSFSVKNGQIAGINGASLSPTVGSKDKMDLMSGLGDMSDRSGTKQEELFGLPDLDTSTMTAQANTGSGGSTTTSSTAGTGNAANQVSALDSPVGNAPVSSPFRANRTCNPCSADHPGTDYAVPVGTTVVATADGTVIRAYRSRTFGNTVIIDHGPAASGSGNVYTLYAHGDSLTVNQGQSVTLGQSILTSGNTGNSTGPHLHYEVIQTSSTPFQRSFFGNVNERFAPVDLKNLIP